MSIKEFLFLRSSNTSCLKFISSLAIHTRMSAMHETLGNHEHAMERSNEYDGDGQVSLTLHAEPHPELNIAGLHRRSIALLQNEMNQYLRLKSREG